MTPAELDASASDWMTARPGPTTLAIQDQYTAPGCSSPGPPPTQPPWEKSPQQAAREPPGDVQLYNRCIFIDDPEQAAVCKTRSCHVWDQHRMSCVQCTELDAWF